MPVLKKLAIAAALVHGANHILADEICAESFPQYNVMIKEDMIHGGSSDFFGAFQVCGDASITGPSFAAGSRACAFDGTSVDRATPTDTVITVGGQWDPYDADTKIYMGGMIYGSTTSTDFSLGQYGVPSGDYGASNDPSDAYQVVSSTAQAECLADFDLIESVHDALYAKAEALKAAGDCNIPTTDGVGGQIMFDTEGFQGGSIDMGVTPLDGIGGPVTKDADTGFTFWCVEEDEFVDTYRMIQVPRIAADGYEEHFNIIVLFGSGTYSLISKGQIPTFWSNGENDMDHGEDEICKIYPVDTGVGETACPEDVGFDYWDGASSALEYPIAHDSEVWLVGTDPFPDAVGAGVVWGDCFNPQKAAVAMRTVWVVDEAITTFHKSSLSWSGSLLMSYSELTSENGNIEGNAYMKSYNTEYGGSNQPNEFHWFKPDPLLANVTCGTPVLSPDEGDPTFPPAPAPTLAPEPTLCVPTPCLVDEGDWPTWNLLAGQSVVGYNSDTEGRAGACGDMTLDNYQIGAELGGSSSVTTALVCGTLTTRNAQVTNGLTIYEGGTFNPYGSTFVDGEPTFDNQACEDCDDDFSGCEDTSARMDSYASRICYEADFHTDTSLSDHHVMSFDADANDPNYDRQGFTVFCTKCSDLKMATKVVFAMDSDDDVIIINVENDCGLGCQEFAQLEFETSYKAYKNKRVVWNFPDYDCIHVSSTSWTGAFLAPDATLYAKHANMQGNVCVKSMAATGEATAQLDYYPLEGTETSWALDCPENCDLDLAFSAPTVSAKTCAQLSDGKQYEPERFGSPAVCGGSKVDGKCSSPLGWAGAKEWCESAGARLCTLDELHNDEASGTGCALNRKLGWSSTPCGSGKYALAMGSSLKEGDLCVDETEVNYARCCADA